LWATHSLPTRHTRPCPHVSRGYLVPDHKDIPMPHLHATAWRHRNRRGRTSLYPNRSRARLQPRHLGVQTVAARRPSRSRARRWGPSVHARLGDRAPRPSGRGAGRWAKRPSYTRAEKRRDPSHSCSATSPRARECLTTHPHLACSGDAGPGPGHFNPPRLTRPAAAVAAGPIARVPRRQRSSYVAATPPTTATHCTHHGASSR
jgi:hypothetical protein